MKDCDYKNFNLKEIYDFMIKGRFLNGDSPDDRERSLYEFITRNQVCIREYFSYIGFNLMQGDGYFYFSRNENKHTLENKLFSLYKWIDILDFLYSYAQLIEVLFIPTYTFSKSQLEKACIDNGELAEKLQNIEYAQDKATISDKLDKILRHLSDYGFITLIDRNRQEYRVLAAFGYFERLVKAITIKNYDNDTEIS